MNDKDKTQAPVLKVSKKTPLKVEAKNGDETLIFWVELPNWSYQDKKKKEREYTLILKNIGKQMRSTIDEVENQAQVSEASFDKLVSAFFDSDTLEPLKAWFLKNIQALDNLDIVVKGDKEEETITRLTSEHEWFESIFSELWSYDYNIQALSTRVQAFFAGNNG